MFASPAEVEQEIRNQVKKALQMGIDPTHLDAHMGTAFSSPGFLKAYIKVGKEFNVPVMLKPATGRVVRNQIRFVDHSIDGPC